MDMALKTYSRVGSDLDETRELAELDGPSLANIDGKQYPWTVTMSTGRGKYSKRVCFKAEIIVFENELDRDLFILSKNGFYSINRPVKPN